MTSPPSISERLAAAEVQIQRAGCQTCRGWNEWRISRIDEQGDELASNRPDHCPECGWAPEIQRTIRLVNVDPRDI